MHFSLKMELTSFPKDQVAMNENVDPDGQLLHGVGIQGDGLRAVLRAGHLHHLVGPGGGSEREEREEEKKLKCRKLEKNI